MRITISTATPKKYYPVGATRMRGKTEIVKQFRLVRDYRGDFMYMSGPKGCLTEWVKKDGPDHRDGANWRGWGR